MAKARLTAGRIRDFSCPPDKGQIFLRDTDIPGLGVRATKNAKAFIFQSKLKDGTTLRCTIGDVRSWDVDAAREEARKLQRLVDQGIDPRELAKQEIDAKVAAKIAAAKEEQALEIRKRYTLRALCNEYCDYLEAKGKTDSARQARSAFKCHIFDAVPDIADSPAREITAHTAAEIVRKAVEKGHVRIPGVLRSYLSAAFNAARKAPFDAKLPSTFIAYKVDSNPIEPIATIPVNRGVRTLTPDELKQYIAKLTDSLTDLALKLDLFSGGQRIAQLLRAQDTDYNEDTKTLRLWDGKGKRTTPREHLLPLAPQGVAIVKLLLARAKMKKTQYLFSANGIAPLSGTAPGKRVGKLWREMKTTKFDLRDIRRTCETMLASIRVSKDVRSQLLSHGISGVQAAHYDRHEYIAEKRKALVAWEKHLSKVVARATIVSGSQDP